MTDTIFIGIAGGTGSGKTTLTEHIKKRFGDAVGVIYHDNYYRDQTGMPFEVRCRQNYDHPDAFETDLMVRHLKALKAGVSIQCPVYSYTDHNRTDKTVEIKPLLEESGTSQQGLLDQSLPPGNGPVCRVCGHGGASPENRSKPFRGPSRLVLQRRLPHNLQYWTGRRLVWGGSLGQGRSQPAAKILL